MAVRSVFLAITILALAVLPMSEGGIAGPGERRADLGIRSLSVHPGIDGYEVRVVVSNEGSYPSDQFSLLIVDAPIGVASERKEVARVSLQPLDPMQETSRAVDWFVTSPFPHRIWAFADPECRVEDHDRTDNVAFVVVDLPEVGTVRSMFDGDGRNGSIGDLFAGVRAEVPIEVRYTGSPAPSMVRTHVRYAEGPATYAPTDADGISRVTLDLSSSAPGNHTLEVNSTISGRRLSPFSMAVKVRDLPEWFEGLEGRRVEFDPAGGFYHLSGSLDVPESSTVLGIEGYEASIEVGAMGIRDEVRLDAFIMTDGTTTIEASAAMELHIGGNRGVSEGIARSFHPTPDGPYEIELSSSVPLTLDLSGSVVNSTIYLDDPFGTSFPTEGMPVLEGEASSTLLLRMEGGAVTSKADISISARGNDVHHLSGKGFGPDSAALAVRRNASLGCAFSIQEGGGSVNDGRVSYVTDVSIWDLGLSDVTSDHISADLDTGGLHFVLAEEDGPTYVTIPREDGSISHVTMIAPGEEHRVRSSNLYKSSPTAIRSDNGSHIVAWTEATSYSSDPDERFSSLRVMTSAQSGPGSEFGPTTEIAGYCSRAPVLIGLPGPVSAALVFLADADGGPRTDEDRSLQVSWHDGTFFTAPRTIDQGRIGDAFHACRGNSGELIVAYTKDGTDLLVRRVTPDATSDPVPVHPGPGRPLSVAVALLQDGSCMIAFSTDASGGTRPAVRYVSIEGYDLSMTAGGAITNTTGHCTDLCLLMDGAGNLYLGAKESFGMSDKVWFSLYLGEGESVWSAPLSIRSNSDLKGHLSCLSLGEGRFLVGWMGREIDGNGTVLPISQDLTIDEYDLSSAAGIISARHSLGAVYSPGDTFTVHATVKNLGFLAGSGSSIGFHRAFRDPASGQVNVQDLGSRNAQFDGSGSEAQVELSALVVENQLGVYIVYNGPAWGGPDLGSSLFLPLAAVPDPSISEVDYERTDGGKVEVRVSIGNLGMVPSGARAVRVTGTVPGPRMTFPGSTFEPYGYRHDMTSSPVAEGTVSIGAGSSVVVVLAVDPPPGMTELRVELEGEPWEGEWMEFPASYTVSTDPVIVVGPSDPLVIVEEGGFAAVSLRATNTGTATIREIDGLEGGPDQFGLVPIRYPDMVNYSIKAANGTIVGNVSIDVWALQPGNVTESARGPWLPVPVGTGSIEFRVSGQLPASSPTDLWTIQDGWVLVERSPTAGLSGPSRIIQRSGESSLGIGLETSNGSLVECIVVIVYNGHPEDGVIVGAVTVLDLEGGAVREVQVPMEVGQGDYLLTVEAKVPSRSWPSGASLQWSVPFVSSFELTIANRTIDEGDDVPTLDSPEVQKALLVSISITGIVLVGVIGHRAYEENRKDRKDP